MAQGRDRAVQSSLGKRPRTISATALCTTVDGFLVSIFGGATAFFKQVYPTGVFVT
jgi:hypothetical protein